MTEPVLSVQGLKVRFRRDAGSVRAVDGLSYDLYPGQTLAIVGESGSGKSVHALSILRLLPQPPAEIKEGRILFKGRNLLELPEAEMRAIRGNRIAMIFQEPMTSLNPLLRVGEQISEAIALHKKVGRAKAWEEAVEWLRRVGIPEPANRAENYPHQFSGGMRQRAMIAMALSCGPEILIADEPTTALDVTIQAQILDLMRDLSKNLKTAIILITHNMGVVAEMAERVLVMYAGRPVEEAPVDALFKNPLHPYTQALLRSVPSLYSREERLSAIGGQPPELDKIFNCCPFSPRCPVVFDRCRKEDPPKFHLENGRMSNCWNQEAQALAELRS